MNDRFWWRNYLIRGKVVASVLMYCLCAGPLTAQSVFYDALTLRKHLKEHSREHTIAQFDLEDSTASATVSRILADHTPAPGEIETDLDLFDAYHGNPFIGDANGTVKILLANQYQAPSDPDLADLESLSLRSSTTSGLFVTNLADGLAKFLVKRTKEELTITFFSKFKDKIVANKHLSSLFPQTAAVLGVIDQDIYQFNAYLEALRENFVKDAKTLPINLRSLLDKEGFLQPASQILATDMLTVGQFLLDRKPVTALIEYLGINAALQNQNLTNSLTPDLKRKYEGAAAGFQTVNLISYALQSSQADELWVPVQELREEFGDIKTLYLFLGLLWQEADGIDFGADISLRSVLAEVAHVSLKLEMIKNQLDQFATYAGEVRTSLDSLKARQTAGTIVYDDYYQFFHSTFSLLETGIRFEKALVSPDEPASVLGQQIVDLLRQFNGLTFNVRQKHYAASISNLILILDMLLPDGGFDFKADLLKYGNFIAIVSEAETSDEVAAAIEAVALPVGSSITKKRSDFSASLNAYTGLALGREELMIRGTETFFGVSAPVGFAFSLGFDQGGSLSLFTPLIDVGALAAIRFNDSQSDDLPDLDLRNILAPGAYLAYGWGSDIPLTIGVGGQMGPNLRGLDLNNGTAETSDSGWRWGLYLSVDIPIFNLYVR